MHTHNYPYYDFALTTKDTKVQNFTFISQNAHFYSLNLSPTFPFFSLPPMKKHKIWNTEVQPLKNWNNSIAHTLITQDVILHHQISWMSTWCHAYFYVDVWFTFVLCYKTNKINSYIFLQETKFKLGISLVQQQLSNHLFPSSTL